jgi:hypothetical protein
LIHFLSIYGAKAWPEQPPHHDFEAIGKAMPLRHPDRETIAAGQICLFVLNGLGEVA